VAIDPVGREGGRERRHREQGEGPVLLQKAPVHG
jgi:hypothetical protein